MLPSALLRVKRKGNKILPNFARLTYENEFAASLLIETYNEHVGKRLEELEGSLEDVESQLEDMDYHPKFIRGLIELLNRRITIEKPSTRIPLEVARRMVFSVSSEKGFAVTEQARSEILYEAARRLEVSVEELIKAFEASYEGSEVITSFNAPDPLDLLRYYNLSLLQTLMFKALSMTIISNMTGAEAKNVLRKVKLLGLMYVVEKEDGLLRIHIDGPASILTQTRRYGTRMAKVLPLILHLRSWRIKADVKHANKRYTLEIDERYKDVLPSKPPMEEKFDSMTEEDFMLRFKAFNMGWDIVREPDPVVVDGTILIPDFALIKDGLKVYLEIMGFWTPEYVEKKLRKISGVKDPMIVAINKNLSCAKEASFVFKESPNIKVILFEDKLKLSDVALILREVEKQRTPTMAREEVEALSVSEELLHSYLSRIEEEPLSSVLEVLRKFGIQDLHDVYKILKKHGLVVLWKSLDRSQAIVKRIY
ncbi:MAG: DUF790 family protein [Candidatus Nezhaarchaeales archaeon]